MSSTFESVTGAVGLDFPEYDAPPPDPVPLVRQWIAAAVEDGVREPLALSLATADRNGRLTNRTVLIAEVSSRGVLFTTHDTSRKARDIAETGQAAGLLYWRETAQQISLSGPVARLDDEENDQLWAARPQALHSMTTASRQSEPLDDPGRLKEEAERLAAAGTPLPRPDRFAGYLLRPQSVEFWSGAENRLHRRLRYENTTTGWQAVRLQP